ncbi:hypothetical protein LTR22_027668, partial [Elasticomyces elasticus]
QETQAKISPYNNKDGRPKMSLAELISQHQNTGSSIKNRTNRFWTYIGNNHMAQHPEIYAAGTGAQPTEIDSSAIDAPAPSYLTSPAMTNASFGTHSSFQGDNKSPELPQQEFHELEAHNKLIGEKVARELDHQREVALAQQQCPPNRVHPTLRQSMASFAETDIEGEAGDDDHGSAYSGGEVHVAQASPVVQLPPPYPVRDRGTGFEATPLEAAIETSLPEKDTISQLDRWLQAQRSTGTL